MPRHRGKGGKFSGSICDGRQLFSQTSKRPAPEQQQPMLLLAHQGAWKSGEGRIWVTKDNS